MALKQTTFNKGDFVRIEIYMHRLEDYMRTIEFHDHSISQKIDLINEYWTMKIALDTYFSLAKRTNKYRCISLCLKTRVQRSFSSINMASRILGVDKASITKVCRKERPLAGGHMFKKIEVSDRIVQSRMNASPESGYKELFNYVE